MLRVALSGEGWIGDEVLKALERLPGVRVSLVAAPPDDRAYKTAVGYLRSGMIDGVIARGMVAADVPSGTDLIVTAGSRWFISERARHAARLGGIGYHPSLLPLHRGSDAVRWAIHMGDKVTGGTVYKLTNKVDGGGIIAQRHVFIEPGDTARTLWRRALAPLGVELLAGAVARIASDDFVESTPQNEALATWEPRFDAAPITRPDLYLVGWDGDNRLVS